jgi:hypothetical protein
MASKKKNMGAGPDSGVGGRPNPNIISTDDMGYGGGRFTRAERNQAAFLGAIAGDCPCGQCELHRSISQAVANPGTQF